MDQLVIAVQRMTNIFALDEADWTNECREMIKNWFLNTSELMLTIFYDGDCLTACLAFPLAPVFDLTYYLREPNQIFTLDGFHDEVIFETLHEDVDGSILNVLHKVYAPIFFAATDLNSNVKGQLCSALNSYLAYLTALHHKMSGITVLYIPSEGLIVPIEQAAGDRDLVKRLETIAVHWIGSIRTCLGDKEQLVPYELMCPPDHFDFYTYRCKYKGRMGGWYFIDLFKKNRSVHSNFGFGKHFCFLAKKKKSGNIKLKLQY